MDQFYDFNECQMSLKQFGGSEKKEAVFYGGRRYMLKYNQEISASEQNENTSSSRNNAFSEYISCHIFEMLGIPVQKTLLGERNGHIVVACEDFCVDGFGINEFEKNGSQVGFDFKDTRYPNMEDIISFIRQDVRIDARIAERRFWEMFVVDALLGNFDRHTGNWGYLYSDNTHQTMLAPVYDCGACLYPRVSDEGMEKIIQSEEAIEERIYKYPKACFMYQEVKVSYVDFMTDTTRLEEFPLLVEVIKEIFEKITVEKIQKVIENTPRLSEVRRCFYQTMLEARLQKILKVAYDKIRNLGISEEKPEFELFYPEKPIKL